MSRPVKELSAKILQGWTLLADSCPTCNVPLVRNREQTRILCVGCRKHFIQNSTGLEESDDANPSTPSSPAVNSFSSSFSASQPPATQGPPAAPVQPVQPTQSVRASEPAELAEPSDHEEEEEEYYEYPKSTRSDQHSGEIAKKLLAGWTLLNDVCPNPSCMVPLVRKPNSKMMFCVSCESWVVREEDAEEMNLTKAPETNTASPSRTASEQPLQPRASPQRSVETTQPSTSSLVPQPSAPVPSPVLERQTFVNPPPSVPSPIAAPPTNTPVSVPIPKPTAPLSSVSVADISRTVQAAEESLILTLDALQSQLRRATSNADRLETMKAMHECAATLTTLSNLRK